MMAKLGFVLLFVIFGGLTLVIGLLATDDDRGHLPGLEQMLQGDVVKTVGASSRPNPVALPSEATSAGKTGGATPAAAPGRVRYTLQLGQFPERSAADALTAQVDDLHMPGIRAKTLQIKDAGGSVAWVTVSGEQDAPVALESAREWLTRQLALEDARIIQLPPEARSPDR